MMSAGCGWRAAWLLAGGGSKTRFLVVGLQPHRGMFGSSGWTKSVAQAQQLVGSPTSLASFRSLLGDEVATISGYAKRLIGSQHPFLHTAQNFLLGDGSNQQYRGLTVLLMSKVLATLGKPDASSADPILPKQRALAEICELIHTATLMHECTVDLSTSETHEMRGPQDDFLFANKMSVLGGDFLLASACTALGRLHNVQVVHGVSEAIGDITEGLFLRNRLVDLSLANPLETWAASTQRLGGSLLSHGCRSAALLAGLPTHVQTLASDFGRHLGVACQIMDSSRVLHSSTATDLELVCSSAPVIFSLSKGLSHTYSPTTFSTAPAAAASAPTHAKLDEHSIRLMEELRAALVAPADSSKKISADRLSEIRHLVASLQGDKHASDAAASHAHLAQLALHKLPPCDARESLGGLARAVGPLGL
eukprot:m.241656 g.241656  ORF g.241656 m.241656 type:complete len:422 (+) comp24627_c0_seq1:105-1370(+)